MLNHLYFINVGHIILQSLSNYSITLIQIMYRQNISDTSLRCGYQIALSPSYIFAHELVCVYLGCVKNGSLHTFLHR